MPKLYKYTVAMIASGLEVHDESGRGENTVVIDATDCSHVLSEILDEYGQDTEIISIVRGPERPYGTDL